MKFEIEIHGIDYPSYFRGAGTAFTDWEHAIVGVGRSEREAGSDALEQACMSMEIDDAYADAIEREIQATLSTSEDPIEAFEAEILDNYAPVPTEDMGEEEYALAAEKRAKAEDCFDWLEEGPQVYVILYLAEEGS